MIPFGKQLLGAAETVLGAASKAPGNKTVRRVGSFGARVGKNTRLKYGERVSQGKYVSKAITAFPAAGPKIWGKGFINTSKENREFFKAAMPMKKAARAAKPDFFPSIGAMSPGKKRAIGMGALTGIGIYGFTSGVDDKHQVSNSVYDLAFNNSNFDEYALGRKMGVRSLLAPGPGELQVKGFTPKAYSDAWQAHRKRQPRVDGSIAFGMYNSRLG